MLHSRSGSYVIFLEGSPRAFLGKRPDWTLAGANIQNGSAAHWSIDQRPFQWSDGIWETQVVATPGDQLTAEVRRVLVRIAPETMRRWQDVGIDPLVEACAQLSDHLCHKAAPGEMTLLTLL